MAGEHLLIRLRGEDAPRSAARLDAVRATVAAAAPGLGGRLLLRGVVGEGDEVEAVRLPRDQPVVALGRLVADLPCSAVTVAATEGRITLAGRTHDPAALGRRLGEFEGMGFPRPDAAGVEVLPPPFCAVLDMLEAARGGGPAATPRIAHLQDAARYRIGEALILDVTASPAFDGRLTVLYVHPRAIVPMLPSLRQPGDLVPAGETVRIGRRLEEVTPELSAWRITGPTGPGLVVALSTQRPVLDLRRLPASGEEMLALLGAALGGGAAGRVEATWMRIEVVE
jgi:hypothetical protein